MEHDPGHPGRLRQRREMDYGDPYFPGRGYPGQYPPYQYPPYPGLPPTEIMDG